MKLKRVLQLIGLRCRHRRLGVPLSNERCCLDCGERFSFNSYLITPEERHTMEHYRVVDSSVRRVNRTLRWRKKA